jgi:hypothetical protein
MVRNLFVTICILLPLIGSAKIWSVDNTPASKADSFSLQGIINIASAGDTIILMPSYASYSSINVNKKLFIYSHGFSAHLKNQNPDKRPILSTTTVASGVNGVVLAGLIFEERLYFNGNSGKILNNHFRGSVYIQGSQNLLEGNLFTGFTFTSQLELSSSNLLIQNNYFSIRTGGANYSNGYSMIKGGDSSSIIRNNLMVEVIDGGGISGGGVGFFQNSSAHIRNNILWSNVNSRRNFQAGNSGSVFQNNITYSANSQVDTLIGFNYNDTMPKFEGGFNNTSLPYYSSSNDLRLKSSSIGKVGGSDNTDPGLYGRAYAYNMFGIPIWLAQFSDYTILNPKVKANQKIKVKIKIQP